MAFVEDVFSVVLDGLAGSTAVRNVFNYRVIGMADPGNNIAGDIAAYLINTEDGWLEGILNVVHTTYVSQRLIVFNWAELGDFIEEPLGLAGQRTGEVLPRFVAWSFRFNRLNMGQRYGFKRFGPISEDDVLGNSPASGVLDELATCAANLAYLNIPSVADLQYTAVRNPVQGTNPTNETLGVATFQRITTQNTRKPFRNV